MTARQRDARVPGRHTPGGGADLPSLRERLLEARRRLVERIALEYAPERTYPDTAWTRMLADIQITIAAVDAVAAEGET